MVFSQETLDRGHCQVILTQRHMLLELVVI